MTDTADARRVAHEKRVDVWIQPHLARRKRGERHPVHDFLFTYYTFRPAQLRTWHPDYPDSGTDLLPARLSLIRQLRNLLAATASRPANLGCFGLHEWAMVYQEPREGHRHDWPLRLGQRATDAVVESHRIGCSHFDAFRFFTPSAIPLNTLQPGRDDREAFEQPGCLHGGMDLYKHAFRLAPLIPSELVADAFELAWDIRILDMRAAPYDFTGLRLDPTGELWTPVCIETADGKREYVEQQRVFAERGSVVRERLIDACDLLLAYQSPAFPDPGLRGSARYADNVHPHRQILKALVTAEVRFVVVGGVAVALHGHLRATVDVDLVIELVPQNVHKAVKALADIGLTPRIPVRGEDLADPAIRRSWVEERNLVVLSFGDPNRPTMVVDVFASPPLDPNGLIARSVAVTLGDITVPIASIADLIEMKRISGRLQDLADIEALEALSHE